MSGWMPESRRDLSSLRLLQVGKSGGLGRQQSARAEKPVPGRQLGKTGAGMAEGADDLPGIPPD